MKFGVFFAYWTKEWKGDYLHFAERVHRLGFDVLEVSAGELLNMSDSDLRELRALTKDLGIEITSNTGLPRDKDIASPDPSVRRAGLKWVTEIMQAMDKLDSRVLAGVLYSHWPCDFSDVDKEAAWERGVEGVRSAAKVAESLGIDYCLEVVNRFETFILNTSAEAVEYCKDVGSPNVKVLLDTFHMNIEEDNIGDAIRTAGEFLGHLHVGENNRKVPGKGHLPWAEIGQALRDIDYQGAVVMEPFVTMGGKIGEDIKVWRDLSNGATPDQLDQDVKESLQFLKGKFLR